MGPFQNLSTKPRPAESMASGRTDLLLRLFESPYFNEWIAIQYLFQCEQPGIQDYLCNKLHELPLDAIERYLLELVYLAVTKPGQALEYTIIGLCSRSFKLSVKVHWLLTALCQDHPKSKHLEQLKDHCNRAALEGMWDAPFRDVRLAPLSLDLPHSPSIGPVAILSPTTNAPSSMSMSMVGSPPAEASPHFFGGWTPLATTPPCKPADPSHVPRSSSTISLSNCLVLSDLAPSRGLAGQPSGSTISAPRAIPPTPLIIQKLEDELLCQQQQQPSQNNHHQQQQQQQEHHHHHHHHQQQQQHKHCQHQPQQQQQQQHNGQPSTITQQYSQPPDTRVPSPHLQEHMTKIRQELGEGEGVTALLERARSGRQVVAPHDDVARTSCFSDEEADVTSPRTRVRHQTYGATLDFMDALSEASSSLTRYSQDERQRALRTGLYSMNQDLEDAARRNVAIWFPMGHKSGRVIRLATKEAVLLTSRERAPFMLFVEVLDEEDSIESSSSSAPAAAAVATPSAAATIGATVSTAGATVASEVVVAGSAGALSAVQGIQGAVGTVRGADVVAAPMPVATSSADEVQMDNLLSMIKKQVLVDPARSLSSNLDPDYAEATTPSDSIPPGMGVVFASTSAQEPAHPATLSVPGSSESDSQPLQETSNGAPAMSRSSSVNSLSSCSSVVTIPGRSRTLIPPLPPLLKSPPFDTGTTPLRASDHPRPSSPALASAFEADNAPHKTLLPASVSAHHASSSPKRPQSMENENLVRPSLSVTEVDELISAGSMAPLIGLHHSPSAIMHQMAHAIASLRGEEPLVRVRIDLLPVEGEEAVSAAGADEAAMPTASTGSDSILQGSFMSASPNTPATSANGIKGMLSKLVTTFVRQPVVGGDVAQQPGVVASPKLLTVTLTVTAGVDLAMKSFRKSRRTPSSEAISLIATKYKVKQLPPAVESGPPITENDVLRESGSGSQHIGGCPGESGSDSDMEGEWRDAFDMGPEASAPMSPFKPAAVSRNINGGACAGGGAIAGGGAGDGAGGSAIACAGAGCGAGCGAGAAGGAGCSGGASTSGNGIDAELAAASSSHAHSTGQVRPVHLSHGHSPCASLSAAAAGAGGGGVAAAAAAADEQARRVTMLDSAGGALMNLHLPLTTNAAHGSRIQPLAAQGLASRTGAAPAQPGGSSGVSLPQASSLHRNTASSMASSMLSTCTSLYSALGVESSTERRRRDALAVYGERWAHKVKRIQKESPQGRRKGWALRCVVVKNGDDCRQEHLALQLIRCFQELFKESGLPLWVRYYDVLITSNKTALIEMIPDALSIHTIKHRSQPGMSLSDHFFARFVRGSAGCLAAQRKFTESLAAYSIITYLLQIKDRHNGNILLDEEGHVIHIDFGFFLSNSPGGVNFESAPFKLTRELLEIMDSNSEGRPSELFDYFKVLVIQGFLACRKHSDRLILLVKMMSKSGLPCFKAGERGMKAFEKRFHLHLTEVQSVQMVLSLISDSLDAWRTRQYDYYQRVVCGIL